LCYISATGKTNNGQKSKIKHPGVFETMRSEIEKHRGSEEGAGDRI